MELFQLSAEDYFLYMFANVRIKAHVPMLCPATLTRSSLNSFVETSTLKSTKSSEVSSTKSFTLDDKSYVKSLI